jgi:tRNA-splicing ligase RtcB
MAKLKLRDRELRDLGYPNGRLLGLALRQAHTHYRKADKVWVLQQLTKVLEDPESCLDDEVLSPLAELVQAERDRLASAHALEKTLRPSATPFPIFGQEHIDPAAIHQMYTAMRLPVSVAGALMPDAHHGYGLPIGGVLATEQAVIPYGVGVDIGCRMALSVFEWSPQRLRGESERFKNILREHTRFGFDQFDDPMDDPVLEHPAFREISVLKKLHGKAIQQIGSSGSGNHFVEFGEVSIDAEHPSLGLPPGRYLALLSHSGSRGLGANIAQHYTQLAMELTPLPKEARHLAWLDLNTEAGQEYWLAMNLAGDYASACHDHIHRRIARALGTSPLLRVENHHNFAWKERQPDGRELIVHRKGATPAGKDTLGIIPGSMTAPGYIVLGKGNSESLASASHGAGRLLSRNKAKESLTMNLMKKTLSEHGVELLGGGLDEAPMAYKDIEMVMAAQEHLVQVLGAFQPRIVRMAD